VKSEIHLTYASVNLDAERAKREFDNELTLLKQNLGNLKMAIDRHNSGLCNKFVSRSSRERISC